MGSGVSCCLTVTEPLDSKNKSTRNCCDLCSSAQGAVSPAGPPGPLPLSPASALPLSRLQVVPRRATRRAPAERMSQFLRHFTVVGDDYQTWNVNYKKWENEEDEEEEQPPAPAPGEEGSAGDTEAGPPSAPRPARDFRSTLRKLFSSHRFQVGGAKAPGGEGPSVKVTRPGGGTTSATPLLTHRCPPRARSPELTGVPWARPTLSGRE